MCSSLKKTISLGVAVDKNNNTIIWFEQFTWFKSIDLNNSIDSINLIWFDPLLEWFGLVGFDGSNNGYKSIAWNNLITLMMIQIDNGMFRKVAFFKQLHH